MLVVRAAVLVRVVRELALTRCAEVALRCPAVRADDPVRSAAGLSTLPPS